MSAPAAKAFSPEPVIRMLFTSSFGASSVKTFSSSVKTALLSAFNCFGRFMVKYKILSLISVKIFS